LLTGTVIAASKVCTVISAACQSALMPDGPMRRAFGVLEMRMRIRCRAGSV
jgi:hypothetical protein